MRVLREFESHRFRQLFWQSLSRCNSVLSGSASRAATAIQCSGFSPKSIARFPARAGLKRPHARAFVIALGVMLSVHAHADALCFSSALFNKSSVCRIFILQV
jgi:hypothetical protein